MRVNTWLFAWCFLPGLILSQTSITASGKSYALVIGVSDYTEFSDGSTGWTDLKTPANDAKMISALLADKFGFEVTSLLDGAATRENIISALDRAADLGPADQLLVYFAGHGFFDGQIQEGFWIPVDARQEEQQRMKRADWIWNSFVTRILSSSQAGEILVMSDACYSGSILEPSEDQVAAPPSRRGLFVIASGDLQPVQDGAGNHSAFAAHILDLLGNAESSTTATDLGLSLRSELKARTGQQVRFGWLGARPTTPPNSFKKPGQNNQTTEEAVPPPAIDPEVNRIAAVAASLQLYKHGATNSAHRLLDTTEHQENISFYQSLQQYLDQRNQLSKTMEVQELLDRLATAKNRPLPSDKSADTNQPRLVACIGPNAAIDATSDAKDTAALLRMGIESTLQQTDGIKLVDRETLTDALLELNLGASLVSDQDYQLHLGKLLPASLLVTGTVTRSPGGYRLLLKLIRTETTEVIDSFAAELTSDTDLQALVSTAMRDLLAP